MSSFKKKLTEVTRSLPKETTLVAVSKTRPVEDILEAYNAGHKIFGENRVQELVEKWERLPKDIEWHLIGHLQTNKVKYVAPFVSLIHAVDSFKLLAEINKQALKNNRIIPCLLQIKIAEEDTKFGFTNSEAIECLKQAKGKALHNINIVGIMGMATNTDNETQIRNEFQKLHTFYSLVKKDHPSVTTLSMGMSSDYKIALEMGSNMVRLGSILFGKRSGHIAT